MSSEHFDEVDKKLLRALTQDSRASAAALGALVGLTRQAVADRMERLRSEGVIQGYTLAVDPDSLGAATRAFVAITLMPACSETDEQRVIALLKHNVCVRECYRVTGDDYFQVRVIAPDIAAVSRLVMDLRATGVVQGTRTMLGLETLFEKSPLGFLEFDEAAAERSAPGG